jgi:hypothetical protein
VFTTQVRGPIYSQTLGGGIYRKRRGDLLAKGPGGECGAPGGDPGRRAAPNAGRPRARAAGSAAHPSRFPTDLSPTV